MHFPFWILEEKLSAQLRVVAVKKYAVKECVTIWPPLVTIGKAAIDGQVKVPPLAVLDDVVTDARSVSRRAIAVDLRNREREVYSIILSIAPSLQRRVLNQIAMQPRITLREVGELRIT